jgi:hypothetical protein
VSGARVFFRQANGAVLSSAMAITNAIGEYRINGLRGGLTYNVQANALDFSTDFSEVTLSANEVRTLNLTIGTSTNPTLSPPDELFALAWTSPRESSRDRSQIAALQSLKKFLAPEERRRGQSMTSRATVQGNPIEVDLTWTAVEQNSMLGYGIYRAVGTGPLQGIDFLRDPMAEIFADLDENLLEGIDYTYAITALNTRYPETENSESDFSPNVTVTPLGDMILDSLDISPLRFRWLQAFRATRYAVFIWSEFPGINTTPIFNNFSSPVTGTSFTYNGPALTPGRTYYYVVLGFNGDDSARTISRIGEFIAP